MMLNKQEKQILWISGTSVIRGAEYVFVDYILNSGYSCHVDLATSTTQIVREFYNKYNLGEIYNFKELNFVKVNGLFNLRGKIKKILNIILMRRRFTNLNLKPYSKIVANNSKDIVYSIYFRDKYYIQYVHDIIDTNLLICTFRLFDRYVNAYIAVSNAVKDRLVSIGIEPSKIKVVYNGLYIANNYEKRAYKNESLHLGFVGNLEDRKNPQSALYILKRLSEVIDNAKITFVYSDYDTIIFEKLKQFSIYHNLDVSFVHGLSHDKMDSFYKSIDYLVITSKKDPLPTVVLESMKNGTPVIGLSVDGVKEMVKNAYNGYIIADLDDVDSLCKNIIRTNAQVYEELSKNAYNTVKNDFNIKVKVEKLDEILFKE